jgi:hypothetical protein
MGTGFILTVTLSSYAKDITLQCARQLVKQLTENITQTVAAFATAEKLPIRLLVRLTSSISQGSTQILLFDQSSAGFEKVRLWHSNLSGIINSC